MFAYGHYRREYTQNQKLVRGGLRDDNVIVECMMKVKGKKAVVVKSHAIFIPPKKLKWTHNNEVAPVSPRNSVCSTDVHVDEI
jgi:hypothetical protein